jgi:hypothetical protein
MPFDLITLRIFFHLFFSIRFTRSSFIFCSDELDIASRAALPALSRPSKAPDFEDDQEGENEDEAFVKQASETRQSFYCFLIFGQGQAAWAQARNQMQSRISANTGAKTDANPFSIGDEDEDAFARELDQAMRQ